MKNIQTYLLAAFVILFFVFLILNSINNNGRKKHKEASEAKDILLSANDSTILKLRRANLALYNSKQKSDTVTISISGKERKEYEKRIREARTIVYSDTTSKDVQQLRDSLVSDDLTMNYVIDYLGTIFSIDFSWDLKQKIITNDNVVKDSIPYPVDKLIPIEKRMVYIGGSLVVMDKNYVFIDLTYLDKKGFMYRASIDPINKMYVGGIGYRLFRF
ncbi:MAG: hypothetical protein IMZ64_13875 [Bacteroidetes bacterium]|nr:hypothetical protein [Bacteroidota bacterium]